MRKRSTSFVKASVLQAIKAEAQLTVKVEVQPAKVEVQDEFDLISFLSFTT